MEKSDETTERSPGSTKLTSREKRKEENERKERRTEEMKTSIRKKVCDGGVHSDEEKRSVSQVQEGKSNICEREATDDDVTL